MREAMESQLFRALCAGLMALNNDPEWVPIESGERRGPTLSGPFWRAVENSGEAAVADVMELRNRIEKGLA